MPTALRAAVVALAVAASAAGAQKAASIRGIVVDSARQRIPGVDIRAIPGFERARTDSAGEFTLARIEAGHYTLRVRRIGYAPVEWTVQVPKGGHAEVQITLGARISLLDTIRVVAGRTCDAKTYEGFLCRRVSAKGAFLDYTDIDTAQVYHSADLLRDIGGFSTVVYPSQTAGASRRPSGGRCTIVLLNGAPATWSAIPDEPYMISAIEVYQSPRDIPKEFRRYTWGYESCWLVAYWTYDFMMKPFRKLRLPYRATQTQ